jgi:hypothetical protein
VVKFPKKGLFMNLETTRPRGTPRNRWQDEVREDGRVVVGEVRQEKLYDREEKRPLLWPLTTLQPYGLLYS